MLKFISETQEKIAKTGKKHLVGILSFFRRTARSNKITRGFYKDKEQVNNLVQETPEELGMNNIAENSKKKKQNKTPSARIAARNVKHFHALIAMQKGLDTRSKIMEGNYVERIQNKAANQDQHPHDMIMH